MKKLIPILIIAMFTLPFSSCNDGGQYQDNVTVVDEGSKGLDLQALGELAKKCKDATTLEDELNKTNSINNLDLDGDNQVDYISVTEYGDDATKALSLTVQIKNAETNSVDTQEVATIQFSKNPDNTTGNMNIAGNQNVYGNNANYNSSFTLTDFLLLNYMFSYHPYYHSPYYYGYYPRTYVRYSHVAGPSYTSRTSTYTKTSTIRKTPAKSTANKTTIKSPNSTRNSNFVASHSLSSPTRSQSSFTVRNSSKPVGSGGFGSRSSSSSSSSSWGRSSSSSSRSSSSRSSSSRSSSRRPSDVRWKKNIQPLSNQLDRLSMLNPVSFYWKFDEPKFKNENFDKNQNIGFIAQEVEKIYPEVVGTWDDGMKGVNYDFLVVPLVQAVKELREHNIKQDSIIERQEAMMSLLINKIQKIQSQSLSSQK